MNNEIKEILEEFLKEKGAYSLRYSFNGDLAYSQEQMLKDYITNLQEEKEDYKSRCEKAIKYINHENFKRTILVGVGTKKYTRSILDNVLNILNGGDE